MPSKPSRGIGTNPNFGRRDEALGTRFGVVGGGSGFGPRVSPLLSGDGTSDANGVFTLAALLAAGGPIGSATTIPIITWDTKGRLTAVGSAAVGDTFDRFAALAANAWTVYGQFVFSSTSATPASAEASYIRATSAAATFVWAGGGFVAIATGGAGLGPGAVDFDAGTVVEVVCKLRVTGFAALGANLLAGVEMSDQAAGAIPIFSRNTATSTGLRRVTIGVDSTGTIYIVTCNGTTVTATSTGVVAVSGTPFKVKMVFTKGTNVVVTIDANTPTTVTATLPTRFANFMLGANTGGVTNADFFGGAWRMTTP